MHDKLHMDNEAVILSCVWLHCAVIADQFVQRFILSAAFIICNVSSCIFDCATLSSFPYFSKDFEVSFYRQKLQLLTLLMYLMKLCSQLNQKMKKP